MIHTDPVTDRWASALFNLALKQGQVEAVAKDLDQLSAELASKQVASFLLGSAADDTAKLAKLEPLLARSSKLLANFVRLLFDKDRVAVLEHLGAAFRARRLDNEGAALGYVESVRPLDEAQMRHLESSLGTRIGKRVMLEQRIVPDLVGGVRVFVGANMIDQSVQGRLEGLRRQMVEAPLPA